MAFIKVTYTRSTEYYWRNLPAKIRRALAARFDALSEELENKVRENLSGKLLQVKSGELLRSLKRDTDISGLYVSGGRLSTWIGIDPASPKAWALEYGGKGEYLIPVGAKGVLANIETGFFSKRDVMHPPAKEYAYLRSALAEMHDAFYEGMAEAIGDAV